MLPRKEGTLKVCVLNGSPKGSDSVTLQYVRFLELAFPAHTFMVVDVAAQIGAIESREDEFKKVMTSVSSADAVLFATPVYYMLVPAQFKRFIELVVTRNGREDFFGKYAASLTTSIHFFDHTANEYLHAVAEDLGMHWTGSFMAKMDDLVKEENQESLIRFGEDFLATAQGHPPLQRVYPPLPATSFNYASAGIPLPLDTRGKSVLIISDAAPGSNLEKMVSRMASCFGRNASIVPVSETGMKGGCLGCCRCAFDNQCVYTDGFSEFWKTQVAPADIIVFAGTVKDRYLSSEFKQVLDRSFFTGHVPSLKGKQVACLVQGPLFSCTTLREVMTAYITVQGANPAGMVSDEDANSYAIDLRIDALAARLLRLAESGYIAPGGFPAVAGWKVFRDEIWGEMRAVFRADDAYYRKHGVYDFPQHDYGQRLRTGVLSLLLSVPNIREQAKKEMKKHMLEPFGPVFSSSEVLKRRQKKTGP